MIMVKASEGETSQRSAIAMMYLMAAGLGFSVGIIMLFRCGSVGMNDLYARFMTLQRKMCKKLKKAFFSAFLTNNDS